MAEQECGEDLLKSEKEDMEIDVEEGNEDGEDEFPPTEETSEYYMKPAKQEMKCDDEDVKIKPKRVRKPAKISNCHYCGIRMTSESALVKHSLEQHGEIKCLECGEVCKTKGLYYKHVSRIHKGKLLCCKLCSKTFHTSKGMKRHLNLHMGLKPHMCDECPAAFADPGSLLRHKKRHRVDKSFGESKQCPECDESFIKGKLLRTHMQLFHPKEENQRKYANSMVKLYVHVCDICGINASSSSALNQHMNTAHGNPDIVDQSILQEHLKERAVAYAKTHSMERTAAKFSVSVASLSKWVNPTDESALCEYCTKSFSNAQNLGRHVRDAHWTEEEQREYMETKKKEAEISIEVPTEDDMSVKHLYEVKYEKTSEVRKTDGINLFTGVIEPEEYVAKHTDDENMSTIPITKCAHCKKKVKNVTRHIMIAHKDVQQFYCDLCNFRATRRNYIRRHMEEDHEGAIFVCPICAQRCPLRDDLKKHIRDDHISPVSQKMMSQ